MPTPTAARRCARPHGPRRCRLWRAPQRLASDGDATPPLALIFFFVWLERPSMKGWQRRGGAGREAPGHARRGFASTARAARIPRRAHETGSTHRWSSSRCPGTCTVRSRDDREETLSDWGPLCQADGSRGRAPSHCLRHPSTQLLGPSDGYLAKSLFLWRPSWINLCVFFQSQAKINQVLEQNWQVNFSWVKYASKVSPSSPSSHT